MHQTVCHGKSRNYDYSHYKNISVWRNHFSLTIQYLVDERACWHLFSIAISAVFRAFRFTLQTEKTQIKYRSCLLTDSKVHSVDLLLLKDSKNVCLDDILNNFNNGWGAVKNLVYTVQKWAFFALSYLNLIRKLIFMISQFSLILGVAGSKSMSLGQIWEISCWHSLIFGLFVREKNEGVRI